LILAHADLYVVHEAGVVRCCSDTIKPGYLDRLRCHVGIVRNVVSHGHSRVKGPAVDAEIVAVRTSAPLVDRPLASQAQSQSVLWQRTDRIVVDEWGGYWQVGDPNFRPCGMHAMGVIGNIE